MLLPHFILSFLAYIGNSAQRPTEFRVRSHQSASNQEESECPRHMPEKISPNQSKHAGIDQQQLISEY